MLAWFVIVIGALAACAVIAWFLSARNHPENAASHADESRAIDDQGRGTGHQGVADRPAGPDAESMASDPAGGFTTPDGPGSGSPPA